ncbi:protein prenyltransferase alpha subunit repeat-containing protein 1-like [Acropora millepora]|uniref:protein prenyltransferase alpha subunit repeat-containing protein 1-like n=1 Tax=Acropora millepora TaxID=45264 RepID=UPI001CF4B6BE|nr:protein prenyltransferase alpha subunit repeat-containing protein 1-like [Acropora millepora]
MAEEPTCCSVDLGERLFCSINKAFIADPDIDEFDIIPCLHCQGEQGSQEENLLVLENHKLGVKSWCIKPLFLFAYNKLIRSRLKGRKHFSLTVTESVQLSRAVLLINAECYTAWNARKEMIASGVLSLRDDWKLSSVVLSKHPRSAETFSHRRWIIIHLEKQQGRGEFIQRYLKDELAIGLRAAECYADNYTAWSHRAWLVERYIHDQKRKLSCELHTLRIWAERHVSDNCGFHYRQCLLKHLKSVSSQREMLDLLLSELEFITDLIWTYPGHEVVWHHRKFIYHVWNQWFSDVTSETLPETACSTSNDSNKTGIFHEERRSSTSAIPSLYELASNSCRILKEFDLYSKLKEVFGSNTSLLSTPAEMGFCDTVIAESEGPVGEVQRRCALNYKRWILLQGASCNSTCNGIGVENTTAANIMENDVT